MPAGRPVMEPPAAFHPNSADDGIRGTTYAATSGRDDRARGHRVRRCDLSAGAGSRRRTSDVTRLSLPQPPNGAGQSHMGGERSEPGGDVAAGAAAAVTPPPGPP